MDDGVKHDPLLIEQNVGGFALDHLRRVIEELLRWVVLAGEDAVEHGHAISASESLAEMGCER